MQDPKNFLLSKLEIEGEIVCLVKTKNSKKSIKTLFKCVKKA